MGTQILKFLPLISLLAASSVMGRRPMWLAIANPGLISQMAGGTASLYLPAGVTLLSVQICAAAFLARVRPLKSAEQLSITGDSDRGLRVSMGVGCSKS